VVDENSKNVSLALNNGTTLLGTDCKLLDAYNTVDRYLVVLYPKYSNVTKVEFTVVDDYSFSGSTPNPVSFQKVVFGDFDCVDNPTTISQGLILFWCSILP
jgi:hypothetical protein